MFQELSFQQQEVGDRHPPQNVDAEEAILGGILLDPEAINRIIDSLKADAFYIGAHRDIFRAAIALHTQGKPTDLTSVATWLKDHNLLDKIGGQPRLAQFVEQTISAVNIDQYAALVMEKYIRRQLITVGTEVAQLGYATDSDLPKILDQAEQKVFSITQSRPQEGLVSMDEILTHTFSDLENRSLGMVLPGLSTNFYDLDAMTQGFQRSDLIIVAGRPSMGKTSFALVVTRNIAAQHQLPVAVFSLEMSKEQLVQRLLSSEVQIESGRLRGGRISQQEWEPLGHGISSLSQLRLFIDDTPNVTITEMRSKVRRLQAEQGGQLGLVMVDYLQLMESGSSDNRVQELSKITRGLKALAREVNVPVIALSQLSRGVEARTNKRPMMSDLRECVTGDTLVMLADGRRLPIQSLVGTTPKVLAMSADEKIVVAESDLVWSVGVKPIFELTLASGRKLKATGQHRIYTAQGWKELQFVNALDRVAIARQIPPPEDLVVQSKLRDTSYGGSSHFNFSSSREVVMNYAEFLGSADLKLKAKSDLFWDEVLNVTPIGDAEVFDLTVPGAASWLADGIVSHNSGAIEQDADLIIMLYRDEYYNPDTPDRGLTEIIITKHRNGPTGTVKLLFEPQFTRFRNLASNH